MNPNEEHFWHCERPGWTTSLPLHEMSSRWARELFKTFIIHVPDMPDLPLWQTVTLSERQRCSCGRKLRDQLRVPFFHPLSWNKPHEGWKNLMDSLSEAKAKCPHLDFSFPLIMTFNTITSIFTSAECSNHHQVLHVSVLSHLCPLLYCYM